MTDEEAEAKTLDALHREGQRLRGEKPPTPEPSWEPGHPIARALWNAMPSSGRGVEYWRLVRSVAGEMGCALPHVQQALLGLVLIGKAYTMPTEREGGSLAGRGTDPRLGAVAYRTGAMGGIG